MGGVSDLTSQEGKDKSLGQRAKEGVQGLTGLQSQHCLRRLAAWRATAVSGWPLCLAKCKVGMSYVSFGRQHCQLWLATGRPQSMPSDCRRGWW